MPGQSIKISLWILSSRLEADRDRQRKTWNSRRTERIHFPKVHINFSDM